MRRFGTQGRVYPEDHYVVPRTAEVADFINRLKEGRYIVLFAPRQTGKTTFFQLALEALTAKEATYFPIQLNFEVYEDCTPSAFYGGLTGDMREKIVDVFQERGEALPEALTDLLETTHLTNQLSLRQFLKALGKVLEDRRVVLIIDEFDAIPVLQVPETPKAYVGQDLLYAYLDQFVGLIRGTMYLEVQTGRGRMDLVIFHNARKYIVETKIWEGPRSYQAGKKQLAAYLQLEGTSEGYYVVFDHREHPEPQAETETVDGMKIRSYVIPVMQKRPSQTS